jgi:hypothetical protein
MNANFKILFTICGFHTQESLYHFRVVLIWFDGTIKLELNFLFFGRKFLPLQHGLWNHIVINK